MCHVMFLKITNCMLHAYSMSLLCRNLETNVFGFELPELPSKCTSGKDSHTLNEKFYKFGIDLPAELLATDCMAQVLCFAVTSI